MREERNDGSKAIQAVAPGGGPPPQPDVDWAEREEKREKERKREKAGSCIDPIRNAVLMWFTPATGYPGTKEVASVADAFVSRKLYGVLRFVRLSGRMPYCAFWIAGAK